MSLPRLCDTLSLHTNSSPETTTRILLLECSKPEKERSRTRRCIHTETLLRGYHTQRTCRRPCRKRERDGAGLIRPLYPLDSSPRSPQPRARDRVDTSSHLLHLLERSQVHSSLLNPITPPRTKPLVHHASVTYGRVIWSLCVRHSTVERYSMVVLRSIRIYHVLGPHSMIQTNVRYLERGGARGGYEQSTSTAA